MNAPGHLLVPYRWIGSNGCTNIRIYGRHGHVRQGRWDGAEFLKRYVYVLEGPPADRPRRPASPVDPHLAQQLSSHAVIISGIEVINTSTGLGPIHASRLYALPLSALIAMLRDGMLGGEHMQWRFASARPSISVMGGGVKNRLGEDLTVWRAVFRRSPGKQRDYSREELLALIEQALYDLKNRDPHRRRNLKTAVAGKIGTTYRQLQAWLTRDGIDFEALCVSVFDEK